MPSLNERVFQGTAFTLTVMLMTLTACTGGGPENQVSAELAGPYLGQEPPGMIPELFAPGLLTAGGNETSISFSPDGGAFCYTIYTGGDQLLAAPKGPFRKLLMLHAFLEDGHWTEPEELPFSTHRIARYPTYSPDGTKLFFNARPGGREAADPEATDMWYVEIRGRDWSEPQQVAFSSEFTERRVGVYPSVAANGNLYFATFSDGENGDIHVSRFENGTYSDPERLTEALQSHGNHPYIAPDESYILFDWELENENYGKNDILISFRDEDGNWMPAQNLGGRVNSGYHDWRPFVSFDGEFLFFSSNRISSPELPGEPVTLSELRNATDVPADGFQHIYWVDAAVIEDVRPRYN